MKISFLALLCEQIKNERKAPDDETKEPRAPQNSSAQLTASQLEKYCDGFQELSRNLEVFFIKVSNNERTYLTNFIAVSISNGHKTKLNSNFVLALSLSY